MLHSEMGSGVPMKVKTIYRRLGIYKQTESNILPLFLVIDISIDKDFLMSFIIIYKIYMRYGG